MCKEIVCEFVYSTGAGDTPIGAKLVQGSDWSILKLNARFVSYVWNMKLCYKAYSGALLFLYVKRRCTSAYAYVNSETDWKKVKQIFINNLIIKIKFVDFNAIFSIKV